MPMKRSLPAVLIAICLPIATQAQRGGVHPAPVSRPAPSFHSNPAPATISRPVPQRDAPHSNSFAPAARPQNAYRAYPSPTVSSVRPAFYRPNRNGHPLPARRSRILYTSYGYPGYFNQNYLDYNGPYLDDTTPADTSAPEDPQPAPDQGPYLDQPPPTEPDSEPAPPPPAPEAVTLVFKDGHSQQIYNFIATRSSISVIQGQRHYDIAVADLDLPATQKANRAAGVDFALPGAAQ
jgi:hypothetical protein